MKNLFYWVHNISFFGIFLLSLFLTLFKIPFDTILPVAMAPFSIGLGVSVILYFQLPKNDKEPIRFAFNIFNVHPIVTFLVMYSINFFLLLVSFTASIIYIAELVLFIILIFVVGYTYFKTRKIRK